MWAGIGTVGLVLATRVNLVWVKRLARPGLVIAGVGMLLPFVPGIGVTLNEARAWIDVGSFTMQPSEFLKLAVVVFVRRTCWCVASTTSPTCGAASVRCCCSPPWLAAGPAWPSAISDRRS